MSLEPRSPEPRLPQRPPERGGRATGVLVVGLALAALGLFVWRSSRTPDGGPAPPVPVPVPEPPPARPVETVRLVLRETPVLSEARDSARPIAFFPEGTVVLTGRLGREATWAREGHERRGTLMEAHMAHGEATSFAFREDLGDELEVRTSESFCERAPANETGRGSEGCRERLRRWLGHGTLVAWDACLVGSCLVARDAGGDLEIATVEAITSAEIVPVAERTLLALTARPSVAGGSVANLVIFEVTAATWRPIVEENVERIERGETEVVTFRAEASFEPDGLHLAEHRSAQDLATAAIREEEPTERVIPWPPTAQ